MTLPSLGYLRFPPIDRHGRKQPQPPLPPSATAPAPATGGIERTPSSGPGSVPGVGSGHVLPTTTATATALPSSSMYDDVVDDRGFNFLCATRLVSSSSFDLAQYPLSPSATPPIRIPHPTKPLSPRYDLLVTTPPFILCLDRWVPTGALRVLPSSFTLPPTCLFHDRTSHPSPPSPLRPLLLRIDRWVPTGALPALLPLKPLNTPFPHLYRTTLTPPPPHPSLPFSPYVQQVGADGRAPCPPLPLKPLNTPH